jgi:hypothetical protein
MVVRSLDIARRSLLRSAAVASSLTRMRAGWITIGKNDLHVEVISAGDIEKGPASMKGDPISSLSDKSRRTERQARSAHALAEGRTGRDYTYKRKTRRATDLGSKSRIEQYESAKSAAKGSGVKIHEVLARMRDAHQLALEDYERSEGLRREARKLTGLNSSNIERIENAYKVFSNRKGFDDAVKTFIAENPHSNIEEDIGASQKVWDMIKEGKQERPKLHDKAVAQTAVDMLRNLARKDRMSGKTKINLTDEDLREGWAPPSQQSKQSREDDYVPFGRSPGRSRLVSALAAGRSVMLPAVKVDPSKMRFMDGMVRLRASAGKGRTFREFSGCAYNGGVMYPSITAGGVTSTMAIVLDLDSLTIPNENRPVLDDHDETTDGVIGQTTMLAVRKSDYTLPVAGVLYTRKARSQKILSASDGGHRWQLSVGTDNFQIEEIPAGQSVRVNQRTFQGPVCVARNAYLTDLSFVAVGGDDTTFAVIAAGRSTGKSIR